MNAAEQAQRAEVFRRKHREPALLLLPNAWDAMSARVFVAAGFDAIATTSGGLAWSLGYEARRGDNFAPRSLLDCGGASTGRFDKLALAMIQADAQRQFTGPR